MSGGHAHAKAVIAEAWRAECSGPLWIGGILLGLGVLGGGIVALAAEGTERFVLLGVFAVVAILPGLGVMQMGRKPNPLASLFEPGAPAVVGTSISYEQGLRGYRARVAIRLDTGATHVVETSEVKGKQLAQALAPGESQNQMRAPRKP